MEHKHLFTDLEKEIYPCFRLETELYGERGKYYILRYRTLIKARSSHNKYIYAIPHSIDKIHTVVPDNRMITDFLDYCKQSVDKRIPTITPESDEDIKELNALPISRVNG